MALLGVNGAGKTTLFSLITRLYDNVSGRIEVSGHDLRRAPGPALAEMGVVFQTRALDADLTVAQNLAYHAALHGLSASLARRRAVEVAAQVGLSELLRSRVARLSGGQQRRAEIARALLHSPGLLLLDEATTGLDVQSRREVVRIVRGLAAQPASACCGQRTSSTRSTPPTPSCCCTRAGCCRPRRPPGSPATAASPTPFWR